VLRSQLIADGKPELALLLNDDRLRDAIRKLTESFQPRPIKKTEWEDKIRPMCVKMADEGYWPPGSSFVGFYHLTENNVDYDGLGLRLNVGGATFNMLAVFDVWYGRRPGANRPPGGAAPAGKSAPAAPMPTIKQQLERPG
jgi:hypothetical protein